MNTVPMYQPSPKMLAARVAAEKIVERLKATRSEAITHRAEALTARAALDGAADAAVEAGKRLAEVPEVVKLESAIATASASAERCDVEAKSLERALARAISALEPVEKTDNAAFNKVWTDSNEKARVEALRLERLARDADLFYRDHGFATPALELGAWGAKLAASVAVELPKPPAPAPHQGITGPGVSVLDGPAVLRS